MNEVLTVAEIKERFPSEYVLLADPQIDERRQVAAGEVLWHCEARDELVRKAMELRPRYWTILYTGPMPRLNIALNP